MLAVVLLLWKSYGFLICIAFSDTFVVEKKFWWFAKNPVTCDLGYNNLQEDDQHIRWMIEKVDKVFDIVLIAEYLDISLILLNDLLHWDIKD